jgi:hypothetical protein
MATEAREQKEVCQMMQRKRSLFLFLACALMVAVICFSARSEDRGNPFEGVVKMPGITEAERTITISNPDPPQDGERGSLNPKLSVTVRHSEGKSMDITFRTDASGEWRDIGNLKGVGDGRFSVTPRDMTRRGETYHWGVAVTDGTHSVEKEFSFNLAYFIGPNRQVVMNSDCWKYGYIKHGREKGTFFVTTQRGMWAAYDLDRGWYRTFQRVTQRRNTSGKTGAVPKHLDDGGNLGHPFWGYWGGMYHVLGKNPSGWQEVSGRTFEGLQKLTEEDAVRDLGIRTEQPAWPEGTTYTFSEDRAWIMAVDAVRTDEIGKYDDPNKRSNVKYWEWTKEGGWKEPVVIGSIPAPNAGRVALVRHTRDIWYLFVGAGEASPSGQGFSSTLSYFKTTDAGKTWGELQDTGIPAHALWSSFSFARYGDNYYVFVSANKKTLVYFTRDLEDFPKYQHPGGFSLYSRIVADGMWARPHGTLLHQSALIFVVAADLDYIDEEYGVIVVVPEMLSHPETPTDPSPGSGASLPAGTVELTVKVHGPQTYDVAFYWEDGTFIGEDKLLREGDTAKVKLASLEAGKDYKWYAVARGALLEYYGCEPDTTSDEKWTEVFSFRIEE